MSAIAGVGGGLGLILGGLLVDHVSYHWIFWVGALMGAAAAVGAQIFVPESPVRTPSRVDIPGAILLATGLTLPLLAISEASHVGWGSARTIGLTAAGLVVLTIWVVVERRTPQPLANIRTLTSAPVLMTNIATLLVGFGMFGSFILIPTLAQAPTSTGYGFGADATHAGFLLLPGSLAMLFLGPLSGVVGARFGNKVPLAIGGFVTGLGLALLAVAHGTQLQVLLFCIVMSSGIGLAFAAMPNLVLEAVPPSQTGEATGFNALVRSVGSSLGSQVSGTLLASSAIGKLPRDSGFTHAFGVSAVVAVVAGGVALLIPRTGGTARGPALDAVGAAGPLAEPAYADERF
jgi:MFS family permease